MGDDVLRRLLTKILDAIRRHVVQQRGSMLGAKNGARTNSGWRLSRRDKLVILPATIRVYRHLESARIGVVLRLKGRPTWVTSVDPVLEPMLASNGFAPASRRGHAPGGESAPRTWALEDGGESAEGIERSRDHRPACPLSRFPRHAFGTAPRSEDWTTVCRVHCAFNRAPTDRAPSQAKKTSVSLVRPVAGPATGTLGVWGLVVS